MKILAFLVGVVICLILCGILDGGVPNYCDRCIHRFCASNQHPTVCDECKDWSNYKPDTEESKEE